MRLTSLYVEPGRCMHAKTSICDERMLCRLYSRLATMWQISNSSYQLPCFIGRLRLFRPLNFQQLTVPSCGGYLLFSRAPCYCFLLNICSERQKLPRIFYSLRKTKNFRMTVFRSLSYKFPAIFQSQIFRISLPRLSCFPK